MDERDSPQQQVFNEIWKRCELLECGVYDYLPDGEAKLPFVFIGEQFDQDRRTKQSLYGDVQQTIHIYGNHKQRKQVTNMIFNLKTELRRIKSTDNFYINVTKVIGQTMIDTSTSTTLLHGIVEVDFTFN